MAQFNIHDAKTQFSRLLEMAERGEEVIIARSGKPLAQLVSVAPKKSLLGKGVGDPNYNYGVPDEGWFAPLTDEELQAWDGERP